MRQSAGLRGGRVYRNSKVLRVKHEGEAEETRSFRDKLAVHPKARRRGIASRLMAVAEQRLVAAGCPKLNIADCLRRPVGDPIEYEHRGGEWPRAPRRCPVGDRIPSLVSAANPRRVCARIVHQLRHGCRPRHRDRRPGLDDCSCVLGSQGTRDGVAVLTTSDARHAAVTAALLW